MRVIVRPLPGVLDQADVWVHGERLEDMDRHHRANLIPFLRRSALTLHAASFGIDADPVGRPEAEEWLEQRPLMRRLVELEQSRPIEDRHETHRRNVAYEKATGYRKVTLLVPVDVALAQLDALNADLIAEEVRGW